ncbi:hypothetical protein FACS1894154_11630 [Betaproteobacteria bacterium]|nr:hypothetical protein FACS1894154_11630 [Betaproteobacteria bacterium]GHU24260.1 hypothetical protein FACS189488_08530 [Betaproteobacteria bacterium]GHU31005.1 hypothetical protein FACS189497_11400 [Betaproteobacteria bacterium]
MTKEQAALCAQAYLDNLSRSDLGDRYVLIEESTIEKPYGWIFVFNSKKFLDTGNFIYALGGNGPIIVEKDTGVLHQLGTAMSLENSIKEFEEKIHVSSGVIIPPVK